MVLSKPYNRLVVLFALYVVGVVAVALVLAWSLLAAWASFLSLTAIVFLLAFRSIFPPGTSHSRGKRDEGAETVASTIRELQSMIKRGFEDRDPLAQLKTFEALKRIFTRKIKRRYGMSEDELKGLMENPKRLEELLGDSELMQLLSSKISFNRSWTLGSLSRLIGKVEDWGR